MARAYIVSLLASLDVIEQLVFCKGTWFRAQFLENTKVKLIPNAVHTSSSPIASVFFIELRDLFCAQTKDSLALLGREYFTLAKTSFVDDGGGGFAAFFFFFFFGRFAVTISITVVVIVIIGFAIVRLFVVIGRACRAQRITTFTGTAAASRNR